MNHTKNRFGGLKARLRPLLSNMSEGEQAVLASLYSGHYNMGDYWAGSVAHLRRRGFVFYGRVAGQCVVYLTPKGFRAASSV